MLQESIQVQDLHFKIFIDNVEIEKAVKRIGKQIVSDLGGKEILFIGVLNGAFMFAADLMRAVEKTNASITFLKLASYQGTSSTGKTKKLIGINEELQGKRVVVIEDIIDTGVTLESIVGQLHELGCAEVYTAALLLKPEAYASDHKVDYVGFEIPNKFVVGYGLDYNGYGRNLKHIYKVVDNH